MVGHALIDKSGKVIREINQGSIHFAKKFFFHIQGTQAQVILFSGEKGLTIHDFKSAQVEGDYLKIKLTDETMGVISLDGRSWLYKPTYYDVTFTKFPPHHAWVKEDTLQTIERYSEKRIETYEGCWMLVDTTYKPVVPFPFSFPVNLIHYSKAIFQSGEKIGLIDSSLNVIYPPEHELIHPIRYSDYVLIYNEGNWTLGHSSGDILNGEYNSLSYNEINKCIAVFSFTKNDTLIGFVKYDKGFKWVTPMTEMHELIANGSIAEAMRQENDPYLQQVGLKDSLNRWRVQNNTLIINHALRLNCTARVIQPAGLNFIPDFEFNNPRLQRLKQQFFDEVNTRKFRDYVACTFTYPEELKDYSKMSYQSKCLSAQFNTSELLSIMESDYCSSSAPRIFKNYIYSDRIQEVQLDDLLVRNEKTSSFLRAYIIEFYSQRQSVEACPDLDKIEELIWSDFYFRTGGLFFPDLQMRLSYSALSPYLTNLGKGLTPW